MKNNWVLIVGALIAVIFLFFVVRNGKTGVPTGPGELDTFATCLKDSGTKFFGAFWCPHCAAQKALFGNSVKLLPYIECSTADGKGQLQVCIDNKISSYPTWEFPATGTATTTSRLTGEIPLATLSEQTNCPLPTLEGTSTSAI